MDKWIIRKEKLPEDYNIVASTSINVPLTTPSSKRGTESISTGKRKWETNPSYVKICTYISDYLKYVFLSTLIHLGDA